MTDNRAFKQRARLESKITGDKYSVTVEKLRARAEGFTLWNLLSDADYVTMLNLLNRKSGLTLFTGQTGRGKTTIMSSALNHELIEKKETVVIDDQNELKAFFSKNNAFEISEDSATLSQATYLNNQGLATSIKDMITAALRMEPDRIVVGEIREKYIMGSVLKASDTGRSVLATLHTGIDFEERLIMFMGSDNRMPVTGIVQSHNVYVEGTGLVFLYAVVPMNYEAVALLEQGRTAELNKLLASQGIKTIAAKLTDLVQQGIITRHPYDNSYMLPEK